MLPSLQNTLLPKIEIAQIEVIAGRPDLNFDTMIQAINQIQSQTEIILFSEMCLSGYFIGDLWEEQEFLDDVVFFEQKLLEFSRELPSLTIIYGAHFQDPTSFNESGRFVLYNCAKAIQNGVFLSFCDESNQEIPYCAKANLPQYREFDDKRWFSNPPHPHRYLKIQNEVFYVTLCEDGWDEFYPTKLNPTQNICAIFNLSCSPFTLGKTQKRNRVFASHAQKFQTPLFYANCVGTQNVGKTLFSFDGESTIYFEDGTSRVATLFQPSFLNLNTQIERVSLSEIEILKSALVYSIQKFCKTIGVGKVVIGASGGVDSAVSAVLHTLALGAENVTLVNMPSQFNSDLTKNAARELAELCQNKYLEVPIQDSVNLTIEQLNSILANHKLPQLSSFNIENIQARDRSARVLAGIASALGAVFSCNGNKMEMTSGYATLYGDIGGYLAPLADLWKYQVYDLAQHFANLNLLPQATIDVKPSAELSEKQDVTQGLGDPLEAGVHDVMFSRWIDLWHKEGPLTGLKSLISEYEKSPKTENDRTVLKKQIAELERWWKAYKGLAVSKRVQAPPVLAVSRRAFGFDHREAILQSQGYWSQAYLNLKATVV